MRLTIVRQDYRPEGTAERVTERALEALLERNVAVSLYTRSWPQTRLQLVEPLVFDPFHVGALWRDWGFARAACRDVRRSQPSLVESHERMLCCDVYRAGDGVHAVWLEEQAKQASPAAAPRRHAFAVQPLSAPRREAPLRQPVAARRDLQLAHGARRDPRPLRACRKRSCTSSTTRSTASSSIRGCARSARPSSNVIGIDAAATVFLLAAADFARAGARHRHRCVRASSLRPRT